MSLSYSLIDEFKRSIPSRWFEVLGADIYQHYVKMRLKYLHGEIEKTRVAKPIEYVRIETGKRQKMIFFPGFADTKENFFDPAQFLINEFDMIIPDLPGFGKSFKDPQQYYNLKHYGDWLVEFIEETGWTDFHLVGNSLGGAAAIEVALRIPEKIKSLTVIDCAGVVIPAFNSIYHEFVEGRNVFAIHTQEQFKYFLNRVFFKPPLIPPFVWDHLYQEFSKNSKWHRKVLNDLLENIKDMSDPRMLEVSLNNRLNQIKLPTLIVWGDEDTFFPPEVGQFVKQQIPHAKLYVLHDRGHSPQVESPWQFARLFKKFARELDRKAELDQLHKRSRKDPLDTSA